MSLIIVSLVRFIIFLVLLFASFYMLTYVLQFLCNVLGLQRLSGICSGARDRINLSLSKIFFRRK